MRCQTTADLFYAQSLTEELENLKEKQEKKDDFLASLVLTIDHDDQGKRLIAHKMNSLFLRKTMN